MQSVSSAFTTNTAASFRKISHKLLVAWQQTLDPTVSFFTLDVSHLDGPDILKGIYGDVTFFDHFVYTEESPYVMDWQITRSVSQQPWGVIMATATVTLDNTSNRFFPGHDPTIGAYVLYSNRPVKIQVGFNGELINVFTGFTDNTSAAQITSRQYVMNLYDAMTYLSSIQSKQATMLNMTRDQIITSLLNEAGFTSGQIDIEPSVNSAIPYYNPYGQYMTDIFTELCESEGALMFADENGKIHWWTRPHIDNNKTIQWAFNYSNTMGDPQYISTTIINDVLVTTSPLKVGTYANILSDTTSYYIPAGGSVNIIENFSSAAASSVDTPHWVSGGGTGNSTLSVSTVSGGADDGVNGSHISLTSHTLTGKSYLMTLTNTGITDLYVTNIALWGVPVTAQSIPTQSFIDQTSINDYGLNPNNNFKEITIPNDTIQTALEATALGETYIGLYGSPFQRFKIKTFAVPQLQSFDWVSMTPQEIGVALNMVVMASTLELKTPGNLLQELDIEQRIIYNYFILDVSKLDGTDVLAP